MTLTNTRIRNAKPGEKATRLFDERGLYLEISPSGGKWWHFKYRFGGKEKRFSLGVYPDVTLKEARDRRDAARKLLSNGVDPSENRKALRSAQSERATNSFRGGDAGMVWEVFRRLGGESFKPCHTPL